MVVIERLLRVLAALLLLVIAPAYGHGDGKHAAESKFDPARAEQKTFGIEGDPAKVTRTIRIEMHDTMRFMPSRLRLRQGETVRFVVRNAGKTMHEMVIGTRTELEKHAELMRKFPSMEHDEPYMAHVSPGKEEQLVWKFNRPGEFEFGCLLPGHLEAGMVGRILVSSAKRASAAVPAQRHASRQPRIKLSPTLAPLAASRGAGQSVGATLPV